MGQIIADTTSVVDAVLDRFEGPGVRVSVIGHSLGGYLALHVGALTRRFDKVMSNGSFMPYGCVNSSIHCHCEHLPDMYGMAELHDVAGMMAPETTVDILFGARDQSLKLAAIQMYDELVYIFDKTGAPTRPGFHVSLKNAHEVDPEKVLDILEGG
jgi:pimeloyl-ACP methyl ester carboxylesterase